MKDEMTVCGKTFRIIRLLGRGKGGYSYLTEGDAGEVVLKQIHHEPCDYYSFGNKLEAERYDYGRLAAAGIRIPKMLAVDAEAERIVKEYVDGPTVMDLLRAGGSAEQYLPQVGEMSVLARAAGLNLDWFPTNFVVRDGLLWYVDYECNAYADEWSFETWGVGYWSRTPALEKYLRTHPETVTVVVDRPLGSRQPDRPDVLCPVNCGRISGTKAPGGEEQDACVLGVNEPVERFTGEKIAVIRRADDVEDKWVVVPPGLRLTAEEILSAVRFQERYFGASVEILAE